MVLALSFWLAAAPTLGERLSADVWCQPSLGVKTDRMNCMVFERAGTWRFVRTNLKVEDEVLGSGEWKVTDGAAYAKTAK